ncbi:MAG: hypothetical protein PHW65_05765 [Dehalococcoidales bacterium]|nr:hypothetical protein [Dehalococcoidales bacterium]
MNKYMQGPSGWGYFYITVLIIGLSLLMIWAVFQWFRFFNKKGEKTACDIADERYAKGEISKKELHEIKEEIASRDKNK